MLSERIRSWRLWPGIWLGALIAVALWGLSRPPPVPPTPSSQGKRAEEAAKVVGPKSTDERLADYTEALAWWTAVLAGVAFFEIVYLAKADRASKRGAEIAERQTLIAEQQTNIIAKQHEVGRLQYFATQRPRIIVRDVYFTDDEFLRLTFELSNTGGDKAKITAGFVALAFVWDPRQFKDMREGELTAVDGAVLEPGQLRQFTIDTPPRVGFSQRFPDADKIGSLDTPHAKLPPEARLFFFGALTYADSRGAEFGVERLSVFRRQWHNGKQQFLRTDDPDHEYAD